MDKLKCSGCISIKDGDFPFTVFEIGKRNDFCIDQEGCGIGGLTYLEIRFCPVCGVKLHKERKNG